MRPCLLQFDASRNPAGIHGALEERDIVPKIADFGMARHLGGGHAPDGVSGRFAPRSMPWYVSPEALQGQGVGLAGDVYAFGVMMWELMMGCSVFVNKCGLPGLPLLS